MLRFLPTGKVLPVLLALCVLSLASGYLFLNGAKAPLAQVTCDILPGQPIPFAGADQRCNYEVTKCEYAGPGPYFQTPVTILCDTNQHLACVKDPAGPNSFCRLMCGNGSINPPETCDDGNTVSGDGCSSTCSIEVQTATCVDGIVQGSVGAGVGAGAAASAGTAGTSFYDFFFGAPTGTTTMSPATAGGTQEGDDGKTGSGDGCSSDCKVEPLGCGNGRPDPGEQCDKGTMNGSPACTENCCTKDCKKPTCSDGINNDPEEEDGTDCADLGCDECD